MASQIIMYVGKEVVKMDLDNLLSVDIETLDKITYDVAKKYGDFLAAIEIAVEDCSGVVIDIQDETSYKLAIADLINIIIKENEEENLMNKTNNATVKGNVEMAVEEMMDKFAEAKESIKVNVGETAEEYIERVDDSVDVMKGALGNVLGVLDGVVGYSILKDSILDIMEAGTTGKSSKKDLFKMAKKCRELLEEEIANLEFWGDQESLGKAVQLKALVEADRDKSVFEAFVSGCVYIAKKVARKLRKWFKVDDEKSVIGAICRSISGLTKILRAGVKIVWNTAKFAVSFIVAGAVKLGDFIVRTFKSLFDKIKEWATTKFQKLSEEDAMDNFDEENFFVDDVITEA